MQNGLKRYMQNLPPTDKQIKYLSDLGVARHWRGDIESLHNRYDYAVAITSVVGDRALPETPKPYKRRRPRRRKMTDEQKSVRVLYHEIRNLDERFDFLIENTD